MVRIAQVAKIVIKTKPIVPTVINLLNTIAQVAKEIALDIVANVYVKKLGAKAAINVMKIIRNVSDQIVLVL